MARDWPDARGIYLSEDKHFIIWVNEEDHMRIISMQNDGDMKAVFNRFCNAVLQTIKIISYGLCETNQIEANMQEMDKEFMHSTHLGYIVSCPSNRKKIFVHNTSKMMKKSNII